MYFLVFEFYFVQWSLIWKLIFIYLIGCHLNNTSNETVGLLIENTNLIITEESQYVTNLDTTEKNALFGNKTKKMPVYGI